MNQSCFISLSDTCAVLSGAGNRELRVKRNNKGGATAADAVYTNAPTQPQFAQAHGLCNARGKRNTHGVRTNG